MLNAITRIRELRENERFVFLDEPNGPVYRYRGNGWYHTGPYDGGPWHLHSNVEVIAIDREDTHREPFSGGEYPCQNLSCFV